MKKLSISLTAIMGVIVIGMLTITSCKKNNNSGSTNNTDSSLVSLLTGSPAKVWQLNNGDASQGWDLSSSGVWQQFDVDSGRVYTFSDCIKNNDHIAFHPDGTYTQSTYVCDINALTDTLMSRQVGDTGKWSLAADNVTLTFGTTYRLISVNATNLIISDSNGTFNYIRVDSQPFLTSTQQLTGTGSKAWKISNLTIAGVAQPLTDTLAGTRFIYTSNGVLTTSFTDSTYGQPATGTWYYNQAQNEYIFTFPASGASAAVNQTCAIEELTSTSFIYNYVDSSSNYITTYLVPE
jgi:hypothetical protein